MPAENKRCGYVAIVGRPNVGKSTLLNHILGQKISITSRKPQTTRHQVLGIKTEDQHQIIFVDTPGLHKDADKAINRFMNRAASSAIKDVDLVVFVVDRTAWTEEDDMVLEQIQRAGLPTMLVVNKVDLLAADNKFNNPDKISGSGFDAVMSTLTGEGVEDVMGRLVSMIDIKKYDSTINKEFKL